VAASRGRVRESLWVWVPLATCGIGTWAAFVYAGTRARRSSWKLVGFGYLGLFITAIVLAVSNSDPWLTLGGFAILFVWVGGFVHALIIRSEYVRVVQSPEQALLDAAEARLRVRTNALQLARKDPVRAKALGVGRPDIDLAFDGGLTDVNSAPAHIIARLPHADESLAERIVAVRERVGGFSSNQDLGLLLGLPAPTLDAWEGLVVCLPANRQ
jgi:SARP family transcriptional regulator, regulator of embCAB operon